MEGGEEEGSALRGFIGGTGDCDGEQWQGRLRGVGLWALRGYFSPPSHTSMAAESPSALLYLSTPLVFVPSVRLSGFLRGLKPCSSSSSLISSDNPMCSVSPVRSVWTKIQLR